MPLPDLLVSGSRVFCKLHFLHAVMLPGARAFQPAGVAKAVDAVLPDNGLAGALAALKVEMLERAVYLEAETGGDSALIPISGFEWHL